MRTVITLDSPGFAALLAPSRTALAIIVARFCRLVSWRQHSIAWAVGILRRRGVAGVRHGHAVLVAAVLAMLAAPVPGAELPGGKRFLGRGAQGWFWYERIAPPPAASVPAGPAAPAKTPEQPMPAAPPPAPASGPAPLSAAWFRAELEHYRDLALDQPSPENVRAYLYLQKVMLDKADGFARVSGEVAASDPYLDATTERPLAPFAANAASAEATARRSTVLTELSTQAGILLVVEGSCSVCVRQAEVLHSLQRQYGFAILAVSLDGATPTGLRLPVRPDAGQAARLRVIATPALYLMRPPDTILPLAQGALDQDSLVERIVAQAHRVGWLDDATYAATRPVRTPFAVPGPGSLTVEAMADPVRLVAHLRATLGLAEPAPPGALP